ncbi:MAG: hypothetical protein ACTHZW_10860 [Microbacteriaceae bacterium]
MRNQLAPLATFRSLVLILALSALTAVTLSGCMYSSIPAGSPTGATTDDPTPVPTESTPSTDADLPVTLTFDDGALLPESVYIEWGDGLLTDDGWEVVSPDDGNGTWTYGTVDGTCTAQFWQGLTGDVETTPGDDSASSDAILATLLQTDAASVTPSASDGAFSYQIDGNADVEHRRLLGQQDDRDWIMAARAFTATGVGVYLIVDCTGGDANAVFAEVTDSNPVVVH